MMKEFIRAQVEKNLDKILLTLLYLYMVHIVLILALTNKQPDIISWARELTSGFQGALLGYLVRHYQEEKKNELPEKTGPTV